MFAGGVAGTVLLGFPLQGAKRRKHKYPKRTFDVKDADEWVREYKGHWVLLEKQGANLKIVPERQYAAYVAEEKAILERFERAKREAEEQSLRRRELIAYRAIRRGVPENLDEYLNTFPLGAHRAEVERLVATYPIYRSAVNGRLKDSKDYLSNGGSFFEKIAWHAWFLYWNPSRRKLLRDNQC